MRVPGNKSDTKPDEFMMAAIYEVSGKVLDDIQYVFGVAGLTHFCAIDPGFRARLDATLLQIWQAGHWTGGYDRISRLAKQSQKSMDGMLSELLKDPPEGETEDQLKIRVVSAGLSTHES